MSFPRYPAYKNSGVNWLGDVPEHWLVGPVRNFAAIVNGYPFDSDYFDISDGSPLVRIRDLGSTATETKYTGTFLTKAAITSEDLLIGMDGDFNVGRWLGVGQALLNQRMCCVRGNNVGLTRFLEYALPTPLKAINEVTYGTTVKHLASSQIEKTFVAVPPGESERASLLAFLDRETAKIDALVAEQWRLAELLKEKRQAVIAQAVTRGLNSRVTLKHSGIECLGEIPAHWDAKRLKHVKSRFPNAFVDGPFGSNLKSEHFVEGGDVYVIESNFATQGKIEPRGLKTITLDHFRTIDRSETRGGDIIIAKIGAQFGKSSILPPLDKPAVVSGNSLKLTIDDRTNDVRFVQWQLTNLKARGDIDLIVNGTAQPALSLAGMNNLPVLVPPLSEQRAIVALLESTLCAIDALICEVEAVVELLHERRAALISAAVTGQIDVRQLAGNQAA